MTTAELVLLSLIAEQERHGYEIEELLEQRGVRAWADIGFSSIYYVLKKLEEAGLITSKLAPAPRGPARRIYSITQQGIEILRENTRHLLTHPVRPENPFLLGLSNIPLFSPSEIIAALEEYRAELQISREQVESRRDEQQPLPYFVEAMFEYSIVTLNAQIEYLAHLIQRVKDENRS